MKKIASAALFVALLAAVLGSARAAEKITFATNWKAEAEHGGYYQAVAQGIYARHGLDVTRRNSDAPVLHSIILLSDFLAEMGRDIFYSRDITGSRESSRSRSDVRGCLISGFWLG